MVTMTKKKRQTKKEKIILRKINSRRNDVYVRNLLIVLTVLSFILFYLFIAYESYSLQMEWKTHMNNNQLYMGNGRWTPPLVLYNDSDYINVSIGGKNVKMQIPQEVQMVFR